MSGSARAQGGETNVVVRFGILAAAVARGGGLARGAGPAAAQLATVTGRVLDVAGEPAAGVRVSVEPSAGNAYVTTGPDGTFSITWQVRRQGNNPPPSAILARDRARNLAVREEFDDTATNVEVRLKPALKLSVKVQDANGKPIPTATATFTLQARNAGRSLNGDPLATDRGVIELGGLPQGFRYSVNARARGYGSVAFMVEEAETRTTNYVFPVAVLKAADQRLEGVVLGMDGKAAAGASVNMSGEGQPNANTTTDAQGHFIFDTVCTGPVQVNARQTSGGGDFLNGAAEAQGGDTNVTIRFGVNNFGNRGNGMDVRLVTATGVVYGPSGTPAAGVRILGQPTFGSPAMVTSEADGKYSITWEMQNLPNNENAPVLYVRDVSNNLAARLALDEAKTNQDLHLQPGLTVTLKAQDAEGHPIREAMPTLWVTDANRGFSLSPNPEVSDEEGRIEIRALTPALRYTVYLTAAGYGRVDVPLPLGQARSNVVDLAPVVLRKASLKLAGQVLGPDGKPASGANVSVNGAGQPNLNSTTDSKGRFAFDGVCEGPVQINANTQGGRRNYMNAQAKANGGDTNVVVRFAVGNYYGDEMRTVTVSGTVFDPDGKPAGGVALTGELAGANLETVNEPDGAYTMTWRMPTGRNRGFQQSKPAILARDSSRNLAVRQELKNESATNMDLRLQPGLTLSATVLDSDGKPIPSATATLMITTFFESGSMNYSLNLPPTSADAKGLIEIKTLPPGMQYGVTIGAKGYGTMTARAQAGETEGTNFVFPDVVLRKADRTLAGQVVGANGKGVAGANVSISGQGQPNANATTDAKGRFAFEAVCEGPVQVSASSQSGGDYTYGNASVLAGETNAVVHLGLNGNGNAVTVTGTVFDEAGAPVSGVVLTPEPSNVNIHVTNDLDGTYSLTWEIPNFGNAQQRPAILARDAAHGQVVWEVVDITATNVDLHLQTGLTLAVKVRDPKGKPISAASGSINRNTGNFGMNFENNQVQADEQGLIEFKNQPRGLEYYANISAVGYGSTSLQAASAQTQTNRCELPSVVLKVADRKLAGRVLGPEGKPVEGANVYFNGEGQPNGGTITDAEGRFAFDAVCEGDLTVSASHQAPRAGAIPMNMFNPPMQGSTPTKGGETNVEIKIALPVMQPQPVFPQPRQADPMPLG